MPNNRRLRSAEHTRDQQQGEAEMAPDFKTRSTHAGQDNGRPELTVDAQMYVSPRVSQNVPTRKPTLIMQHLVGCRILSVGRMGLGSQWPAPCYLDQLRTRSGPGTARGGIFCTSCSIPFISASRSTCISAADVRPATQDKPDGAHYPWRCEAAVIPRPP